MHMISAILTCKCNNADDGLSKAMANWPVIVRSRGAGDEVTSTSPFMRELREEIKRPPIILRNHKKPNL